ncbi:MAG TPA: gluconokinase [Streptosporangiaceae bacterium]|jgi:carbohydrate kinase (thermoresistant glucokinase family)
MIVVVAGVAASGKSTVGRMIADRLGWPFTDADSLHPAANVAKMHAGHALTDADRRPWMAAVTERIDGYLEAGQSAVLACSLLKRSYRDQLTADRPTVRIVFLDVSRAELTRRLSSRHGHFFPATLLDSQLADLEPPQPAERQLVVAEVGQPPAVIADEVIHRLQLSPSGER